MPQREAIQVLARNRRALHDYQVEDRFEAGLVLTGSEVKSLRDGKASLGEAWIEPQAGELWLVEANIPPYAFANQFNHDPKRRRKLLMHAGEIARLGARVAERGYTLVPLELYFRRGKVKLSLGLAKGKRQHDKREAARDREMAREVAQEIGRRR